MTSLLPLTSQAHPFLPRLTVTSPAQSLDKVNTSVTVTGSEEPQTAATWIPVVSNTWDLCMIVNYEIVNLVIYLDTGVLSPAFSLLASKGVPGPLLAPDKGVPDLEPGLGRPEGYMEPFGVNMGRFY